MKLPSIHQPFIRGALKRYKYRLMVFLSIFGPATITAMADNDASGVATYAIAGAKLGYPIVFVLFLIAFLLALTQEMGIRVSLVTQKGLGDLIRENFGIRASIFIFTCLFVANTATIIAEFAAFKTTAHLFGLPVIPILIAMMIIIFLFVVKGNYSMTQNIMLVACLFYISYIVSAIRANPDWRMATTNLLYPHGVAWTPQYVRDYLVIGLGVIGTTITPWGQFFISSFGLDKKLETAKLKFAQLETYWGAFLTSFFSFFMVVATAATLFVHKLPIISGEQAALAIQPFAGKLAGTLFAAGLLNAAFMGIVIVGLSTTYAFSEFFGFSGGLDQSLTQSKTFYVLFIIQLVIGFLVALVPSINLFQIAIFTQTLNAIMLPPVFYYLLTITNSKELMGDHVNTPAQAAVVTVGTAGIVLASIATLTLMVLGL